MAPNTATSQNQWRLAAGLTVVADIAGTLATFMPMKSVFILAADDIPSFFPQPLIQAGPVITALALVGIAGLLAVVSGIAKRTSESLAKKSEVLPKRAGHKQTLPPRSLTLQEFATLALVFVLVPAAAFVSVTFTLLVLGWLGAIATTLAIIIHRRDRRPPYTTGRAEFAAEFKQWVEKTALWATVAAAIVTLLLTFPTLGLTGILLCAILLRRLQGALGSVGHLLLPRWGRNDRAAENSANASTTTAPTGAPLDFLASQTGQRLLRLSLERLSLSPSDWQLIGLPNRNQVSLLAREEDTKLLVLLRVFASEKTELRDKELEFRQEPFDSTPFAHSTATQETIAGLPAILVHFSKDHQPDPATTLTAQQAAEWQVTWEITCIEDRKKQKHLRQSAFDDPNDFLLPHLKVMASIRGPHQTAAREYLSQYEELRATYLSGPPVQEIGAPVAHQNLLPVGSSPEPIDSTNLKVSPFGASWGTSSRHKDTYFSRRENLSFAQLTEKVMIRQEINIAARACRTRNIHKIQPLGPRATNNQSHKPTRAFVSPQTSGLNKDHEMLVELAQAVARQRWGPKVSLVTWDKLEGGKVNRGVFCFSLSNGESIVQKISKRPAEGDFAEAVIALQKQKEGHPATPIIEHVAVFRNQSNPIVFTEYHPTLEKRTQDLAEMGGFIFGLGEELEAIHTTYGFVGSKLPDPLDVIQQAYRILKVSEPSVIRQTFQELGSSKWVLCHNDMDSRNTVRNRKTAGLQAIDFGEAAPNRVGSDLSGICRHGKFEIALKHYSERADADPKAIWLAAETHLFYRLSRRALQTQDIGTLQEMIRTLEKRLRLALSG